MPDPIPLDDTEEYEHTCEIIPIDPDQVVKALHSVAEGVVEALEEALDKAKRGELTGVAIGGVMPNGCLYTNHGSGECSARDLMAAALASFEERKDNWKSIIGLDC